MIIETGRLLGLGEADDTDDTTDDAVVACPMDAQLCLDGSLVGREGPDCEFAECPEPVEVVEPDISDPLPQYPYWTGHTGTVSAPWYQQPVPMFGAGTIPMWVLVAAGAGVLFYMGKGN